MEQQQPHLVDYNQATTVDESELCAATTCRLNWMQADWLKVQDHRDEV